MAEASTRTAGSHAAGEPADWSALAELYAQLGQDDVLHHISSAHVVRSGPCPQYICASSLPMRSRETPTHAVTAGGLA